MVEPKVAPEDANATGEKMLTAIEKITDSPAIILQIVDKLSATTSSLDELAEKICDHYSTRAAISGGATSVPGVIPGFGTLVTLFAAPIADMVLLLKFEVEMCCALTAAHGYDITNPDERQLAFFLAAVTTSDCSTGRSVLKDLGETGGTAIWNYAPRTLGKEIAKVLAVIAAAMVSRRFLAAIPLIGIAVGAGMNKVLTGRVGKLAHAQLKLRKLQPPIPPPATA